jgi:N-methylhydantoinase A
MSADHPLGGHLRIDPALSEQALGRVAAELGTDIKELSSGAIEIALSMMAAEATRVLARRGVDAPDFRLVAYGGAGPLVGVLLAEALQIDRVLIPSVPGALSAMGAARASLEGDHIGPVYSPVEELDDSTLPRLVDALEAEMAVWLDEEADGLGEFSTDARWTAEMRYDGQGWDVEVPIEREWLVASDTAAIEREFHAAHRRLHGHANPDNPVWLKEIRAHVRGTRPAPEFFEFHEEEATAPSGRCTIRFRGQDIEATVVHKHELDPGAVVEGPAVVRQMDTTTLIPPGWTAVLTKSQAFDVTRRTENEETKEK